MSGNLQRAGYAKNGRAIAACPSVPMHSTWDSGTAPTRKARMATNPSIKSLAFQVLRESALSKHRSKVCPKPVLSVGQQVGEVKEPQRPVCSPDLIEQMNQSAKRFAQPHARLFPLIGKKVWTTKGQGILLQVFATRCQVQ